MSDKTVSPHATGIATLLTSLHPHKGDLSYRMEGILQTVSVITPLLTIEDKKRIAEAILRASEAFGQYDSKSGASTNRYALLTLQELTH